MNELVTVLAIIGGFAAVVHSGVCVYHASYSNKRWVRRKYTTWCKAYGAAAILLIFTVVGFK
jgi:hypothetical protein